MPKHQGSTSPRNDGEGNRTTARVRDVEPDLYDDICRELEHAEVVGKRHASKGNPGVKRRGSCMP